MKNNLVLLFFLALTVSVSAQSLPDRKETLEVMKKLNSQDNAEPNDGGAE